MENKNRKYRQLILGSVDEFKAAAARNAEDYFVSHVSLYGRPVLIRIKQIVHICRFEFLLSTNVIYTYTYTPLPSFRVMVMFNSQQEQ